LVQAVQPTLLFSQAGENSAATAALLPLEWFLTHTRFLDEIARILRLEVDVINDGEFDDD
jgi:hypothetical protein